MHECCGPYSEAAKLIERRLFRFRLLIERDAAEQESSVSSEYQLRALITQLVRSPSAAPPSRYAHIALANAALDCGPALGCEVIMQSRGRLLALQQPFLTSRGTLLFV
jgi:hypothetical protein